METKYTIRRLVASVVLSPLVAIAYGLVWLVPVMFGAYGTLDMYLTALPLVLITWVVSATFATQLLSFVERISRP
jgi:hypothetical protein